MAIEFTCPNGHKLKVKESSAGKTGRCPVCNALIRVPKPTAEKLTEDAILGILGPHTPTEAVEPPEKGFEEGITGPGEGILAPKKKVCPKCHSEIETETHICPECQTYIASVKDF